MEVYAISGIQNNFVKLFNIQFSNKMLDLSEISSQVCKNNEIKNVLLRPRNLPQPSLFYFRYFIYIPIHCRNASQASKQMIFVSKSIFDHFKSILF
jgi:hypothetical protein